jgi:hypothetical protein
MLLRKAFIDFSWDRIFRTNFSVFVFPLLKQIILGGEPFKVARSMKSGSNVTMQKSFVFEYSHISISFEPESLRSDKRFESGKRS